MKTLEYWECLKTLKYITINEVADPSCWNALPVELGDLSASLETLRSYGKFFNHSDERQKRAVSDNFVMCSITTIIVRHVFH